MDTFIAIIRKALDVLSRPFFLLGDFWGLTLLSALVGVLILVLVGISTPQKHVERARNKMASAIYEIRLYLDFPKRIVLAQGRLIVSSFIYVLAMLPAFVLMSVPIWLLYLQLEPKFGMEPLAIGEQTILSVNSTNASIVTLEPHKAFLMGGVVNSGDGHSYFQITPQKAGDFQLSLNTEDSTSLKRVVVGFGETVYPERSSGSHYWGEAWGTEDRLVPSRDKLSQISVVHPMSKRRMLGMPWWIYSLFVMTISAFGLKEKLGITL